MPTTRLLDLPAALAVVLIAVLGLTVAPAAPAFGQDRGDDRRERMERDHDHDDHDEEDYEFMDDEDFDEEDFEREMLGFEMFFAEVEVYTRLMDIVTQMHEIAADPEMAGVAAVFSVDELFDEPEDQVEFLEEMLQKTSSGTVKRAIRLQLIDAYEGVEDQRGAMRVIEALITGAE
ncbi:MAG: hypothetical protein AAF823_07360 [Planctomycetota bacterium]